MPSWLEAMGGLRKSCFKRARIFYTCICWLTSTSKPEKYFLLVKKLTEFPFNKKNGEAADDANAIFGYKAVEQSICNGGNVSIEPFASHDFKEQVDEN